MEKLVLVANPGSASRKYALFMDDEQVAALHFELAGGRVICTLTADETQEITTDLSDVSEAPGVLLSLLSEHKILHNSTNIAAVGLRVVAPGGFFLHDHVVDDDFVAHLQTAASLAPLHVAATLGELYALRQSLPNVPIVGISDSAFHITKPDFAWNYGLPLKDADRLDIKRFGYHGISAASVVESLRAIGKLVPKLVVCHLGSGASVTAVYHGRSVDTSMGYSPLEGLIMATRVGSIDPTAVRVLQQRLQLSEEQLEDYLNSHSGLRGLSGISSDIRELLEQESQGNHYAKLALRTYAHTVRKAIGQMSAALGGIDMLVFTGTVGERSFAMRERIINPFVYLDFFVDAKVNKACVGPAKPECVSRLGHSRPIYVVPANEAAEIARRAAMLAMLQ